MSEEKRYGAREAVNERDAIEVRCDGFTLRELADIEHKTSPRVMRELARDLLAAQARIAELEQQLTTETAASIGLANQLIIDHTLHKRGEWHEDDGDVLWWTLPIQEPPYVGRPGDDDFPDYVTHWTHLPDANRLREEEGEG